MNGRGRQYRQDRRTHNPGPVGRFLLRRASRPQAGHRVISEQCKQATCNRFDKWRRPPNWGGHLYHAL